MKRISQLDYPNLLYPTTMEQNVPLKPPYPPVSKAGCGLCCVCMLAQAVGQEELTVEQCVALSVSVGANRFGTDMKLLGQEVAARWGLAMELSNDIARLIRTLEQGGYAIVNVGRENGLLSDGGHFVFTCDYKDSLIWLLDPSYSEEKYQRQDRKNAVILREGFVLLTPEVLCAQASNRDPAFYLFQTFKRSTVRLSPPKVLKL